MSRSSRGGAMPVLHTDRPSKGRGHSAARHADGNPYSFAHGLNFYKLVWIFIIGCIIGFVVETIWCYVQYGHFESRKGLIYGPFSPVYGFGGVLLTLSLYRLRERNGLLAPLSALPLNTCAPGFRKSYSAPSPGSTAIRR